MRKLIGVLGLALAACVPQGKYDAAMKDLAAARAQAYDAVGRISFAGMRFRRDIGLAAAEDHVRS